MTLDAYTVAGAFVNFTRGAEDNLFELMADDCLDHVSGRRGREIWGTVSKWLLESFADIEVELHAVGTADGDRVMIWITTHGTHVGSAFPWMRGRPATGRNRVVATPCLP